jgi:hypothetical protein
MAVRCEDSASRNPRTTGMRQRTPSMGKIVEVVPTVFLTLHVERQVLHSSFMLTFSVGLEQYRFESHFPVTVTIK